MTARDIVFTVTIVAVIAFGFWWAFLDTAPRLSKAELDELIQQTDEEVADFQADIQRRSRLWDLPASADISPCTVDYYATGDVNEVILRRWPCND